MSANELSISPKLEFLPPEHSGEGMVVHEIQLRPGGLPLAPFGASYFTVAPNCSSPIDQHAVHEIWMVAQGEGELHYDQESLRIRPSDAIYFRPPKLHQVRNDGTEPLVIFSVWWK